MAGLNSCVPSARADRSRFVLLKSRRGPYQTFWSDILGHTPYSIRRTSATTNSPEYRVHGRSEAGLYQVRRRHLVEIRGDED